MRAHVGDRIIVSPREVDGPVRDGEIVEVRHPDGSPPYAVRWSDGHLGLVFPGPGAVIRSMSTEPGDDEPERPGPEQPQRRVKTWQVQISVFEAGDATDAVAVLRSDAPEHLTGRGASRRNSADPPVPEVGDEVAVARALRRLSDALLKVAAEDIEGVTGEHVVLHTP